MDQFKQAFIGLFEAGERPEYREKMARKAARQIGRLASEAIALDEEEGRCIEARDALADRGLKPEAGAAARRVTLVHRARCDKIQALANIQACVMKWALGSLRLHEETAWSGLREDDLRLIDAVLHLEVAE